MSKVHFAALLFDVFVATLFFRVLLDKYRPRERTVKFVAPDNDMIVMMKLTTHKGMVYMTFGEGLVDVHDAYDSLEILMKAGIQIRQEPPVPIDE